jgi:hypothetical protein
MVSLLSGPYFIKVMSNQFGLPRIALANGGSIEALGHSIGAGFDFATLNRTRS